MPLPTSRLPRTVIALSAVSFLTDVSSEMIYPLVPVFLAATLGASARVLGTIEGAAEAVAALLKYFSGSWSDRMTRRKPLVLFGYTLSSAVRPLITFAQSAMQVLIIRVGDRIGKGLRSAPRDAMIADVTAPGSLGRAYSVNRAADHTGAMLGPLVSFVLLQWAGVEMRQVFMLAAIPALLAVIVVAAGVKEEPRVIAPAPATSSGKHHPLGGRFYRYLGILFLFTLGNSTDAFLLLRAHDLGVPASQIPLLWALLHVVKASTSVPGGILSDRLGRVPLIVAGWLVYAAVYVGFGFATATWHIWALFVAYGFFYGMTEGVEKALVADFVPKESRGRAFGWYNMTLGLAVFPAALLFGWIWDALGARVAFSFGATMAGLAALLLLSVMRHARNGAAP
jgi:MFS family permease